MENHHHHPAGETDSAAMAELLDLDAEVLHSYLSEVIAWVHELAGDLPRRRILDLGSGTGTGALALVQRFEGAEVIALDISAQLLDRLRDKARDLGVADRVHTVQADLDAAWPAIDTVDLVWASSSLHHMADPHRVLTEAFATIRSGGLLAVAEMDAFPRFLPDDLGLGRPGLEARCHAAVAEGLADEVPHLGSDWGPRLNKAGFTIEAERHFAIDLTPPLPASAGRYAQASLRRIRSGLDGRMSADDLATLDTLIDSDGPDCVLRRGDLAVRTARTVWVARRP
ncbi:MAG: Methyltransferase type 12 [Dactylosporangium sp.]|nr:Methyltransferase type 12 [Dactylosporangium sp.]